jgi:hypothetical protein
LKALSIGFIIVYKGYDFIKVGTSFYVLFDIVTEWQLKNHSKVLPLAPSQGGGIPLGW